MMVWWDYGYWITTLSERTTYVDNATLSTKEIQKMATVLMSPPEESWKMLQEMNADYVVVFVAAQDIGNNPENDSLYVVGGGGDESKILWISRIGGFQAEKYLELDAKTPKPYFYEETMIGKLIPFSLRFDSLIRSRKALGIDSLKHECQRSSLIAKIVTTERLELSIFEISLMMSLDFGQHLLSWNRYS